MVAKIYMEKNSMANLVEDKKVMVVVMSMYKVQVPREVKMAATCHQVEAYFSLMCQTNQLKNEVLMKISPVYFLSQAKKSQEIMRCSFLVHLKVFEDSQEKTGGCTTTQWLRVSGLETIGFGGYNNSWKGSL